MRSSVFIVLVVAAICISVVFAQDPSYDHQNTTYVPQFHPLKSGDRQASIMPFFSPDHSVDTITDLIEAAQSSVDISTPGFSSWIGCTYFEEGCVGCPVSQQLNETFPVFPALLNAAHRGVRIRMLTNNYNTPTCSGKIAPLDWLQMNGVQVGFYTSTTFTHTKYMCVDGRYTALSSVNYSQSSFMKNREAGVVLGAGADDMVAFATRVFEYDWSLAVGYQFDPSHLTQAEVSQIMSNSPYTVTIPPMPNIPGSYVTPVPQFIVGDMAPTIFTSPDWAYDTLMPLLLTATKSVDIMMYQVTSQPICNQIITLHKSGIAVRLLISAKIYDAVDWKLAQQCYQQIYAAGLTPRKTPSYYQYSHQKFAIFDGVTVTMSTGNFSPSDYPQGDSFPPFGNPTWQSVNRDYSMVMTFPEMVAVFQDVLDQDWQRGSDWHPSSEVWSQ